MKRVMKKSLELVQVAGPLVVYVSLVVYHAFTLHATYSPGGELPPCLEPTQIKLEDWGLV